MAVRKKLIEAKVLRQLTRQGLAMHWLHPQSKRPTQKNWVSAERASYAKLLASQGEQDNLGVRLGEHSETPEGFYLYALDIDIRDESHAKECLDTLKKLFPGIDFSVFPTVQSGSGGRSRHIYFVSSKVYRSRNLAHSKKKMTGKNGKKQWIWEIDLFGTGKQLVLPPSIHPDTGLPYEWLVEIEPDGFPVMDEGALDALINVAVLNPKKLDQPDIGIDEIGSTLMAISNDDWWEDRANWRNTGMALHHHFNGGDEAFQLWCRFSERSEKFNLREHRQQWSSFKLDVENPITIRTIFSAARDDENIADLFDDYDWDDDFIEEPDPSENEIGVPDVSILQEVRIAAPQFPLEIFGDAAPRLVDAALSCSAPVDFVAGSILCTASACIGNSRRVKVKAGFVQPSTLWIQIIGNPSSNKSPAMRYGTQGLQEIEQNYEPRYLEELNEWKRDLLIHEAKIKAWNAKLIKSCSGGEDNSFDENLEFNAPPEPSKNLKIVNDITIEAFTRAQEKNPRGFLVLRDELASWLGNMERYKSGSDSDRGIWLESYDGGSYKVDRVKHGSATIRVKNICAPILGGIQPEKLLEITALNSSDDGLQARFMPFWPDPVFIPMSENAAPIRWLFNALEALASLSMTEEGEPPRELPMSNDAFKVFRLWSDKRKRSEQHCNSRLVGVFGKAEGQVARMALVLQLFWWSLKVTGFDDDEDPPKVVDAKAVESAIVFREQYLKPMQERVFAHAIEPREYANARQIAKYIIEHRLSEVNAREIRRTAGIKGINSRTESALVNDALAVLQAHNWLHVPVEPKKPGRPKSRWLVNPQIWDSI